MKPQKEPMKQRVQSQACLSYAESRKRKTISQPMKQRVQSQACLSYAESRKRKTKGQHKLKMTSGVYYVWVAGSCDYGHEERCSGGAYTMMLNDEIIETYTTSDDHTTEFRMILTVMAHAMTVLPDNSDVVFLTNVSYIQQNFCRKPDEQQKADRMSSESRDVSMLGGTAESRMRKARANQDIINHCMMLRERHNTVEVKLVPFHKYHLLAETNLLAHDTMIEYRMHK